MSKLLTDHHPVASSPTPGGNTHHYITTPPPVSADAAGHNNGHRCGYDSFLHATMCGTANANNSTNLVSPYHHQQNSSSHHVSASPSGVPAAGHYHHSHHHGRRRQHHHSQHAQHPNQQQPANAATTAANHCRVLPIFNNRHVRAGLRNQQQQPHQQPQQLTVNGASSPAGAASPQVQGYTKLNSNGGGIGPLLWQQLTYEQKMLRSLTHVERWLNEAGGTNEQAAGVLAKMNNVEQHSAAGSATVASQQPEQSNGIMTGICTPNIHVPAGVEGMGMVQHHRPHHRNLDNLINTKQFVDKLRMAEIAGAPVLPPKKTFNKQVLLMGPRKNRSTNASKAVSASTAETTEHASDVLRSAVTPVSVVDGPTVAIAEVSTVEQLPSRDDGLRLVEYASLPIRGDASECENLLRAGSCSDDSSCSLAGAGVNGGGGDDATSTSSAVQQHRYVHEHIHHHYHHFENNNGSSAGNAAAPTVAEIV